MAERMQFMLALSPAKRQEMAQKNRNHSRNFTWDKAAQKMIEIFHRLAKKNAG
jgi:glycosyltransferase involved in cell wall biosynthesis